MNQRYADPQQILDAFVRMGSENQVAKQLGVNRNSVRSALKRARAIGLVPTPLEQAPTFAVTDSPPTLEEPLETLWERRRESGRRVRALVEHGDRHTVAIHESGPVGILHFGDPHLDDPGCDFDRLADDVDLVTSTPGLYAGVLGDMQNNWVGRLAKLYARQDVTSADSWRLVEEMLRRLGPKLLYLVGGNHDAWSGDGDPLTWIMRQHRAVSQSHGVRIRFTFPSGNQIRLSARHDWPGGSQFNGAFGQGKAAFRGLSDHLVISGHRHKSGYMQYFNANTGILSHCLQVGSYKVVDDFATEKGFQADNLCPSVLTILDPATTEETERVHVYHSARLGAQVLTALRS